MNEKIKELKGTLSVNTNYNGNISDIPKVKGTLSNSNVGVRGQLSSAVSFTGDLRETVLKGISAYESAKKYGFQGTELEWLNSLHADAAIILNEEELNHNKDVIYEKGMIIFIQFQENDKVYYKMKVADGAAYLIDLPYLGARYDEHIQNDVCHITQQERERWNNKISVKIDINDSENLILYN